MSFTALSHVSFDAKRQLFGVNHVACEMSAKEKWGEIRSAALKIP